MQFLEAAADLIATLAGPIEQDVYASRLCKEFEIDKNAFAAQVKKRLGRRSREMERKQQQKIRAELSGRGDRIDKEKAKQPRSSAAEEALVAYLIRNPDAAGMISRELSPEQFQNSLMRRYYTYFLGRIENGDDAMMNVTADFTADEANKIYQILSKHAGVADTRQSLDQYIKVIREESVRLKRDDVGSMSGEELNRYLDQLRKAKK